jgi:hypothetical protein
LVDKSTTGDGIPDWEKILWGLDPTKSENVPGVPDSVTIAKLQQASEGASSQTNTGGSSNTGLTQTDQFSRQFIATITTLQANGAIDANGNMNQATADQITNSLENGVENSPQRKVYQLSDIKIINDNSIAAIKKYNATLNNVFPKTSLKYSVMDVLQKFAPDDTGNNTDPTVLPELIPIVKQMTDSMNGMLATPVPQSLATLHLNAINAMEGVIENLNDVQLYNTDSIVAFSGMSKYTQNSTNMTGTLQQLADAINQQLNK